jgi:hypothetical protein
MPATSSHVVFTDGTCYAASRDNAAHGMHPNQSDSQLGSVPHMKIKKTCSVRLLLFCKGPSAKNPFYEKHSGFSDGWHHQQKANVVSNTLPLFLPFKDQIFPLLSPK